jgi:hypothetical protein
LRLAVIEKSRVKGRVEEIAHEIPVFMACNGF